MRPFMRSRRAAFSTIVLTDHTSVSYPHLYPGYTRSTSGFELSMDMYDQALSFGAKAIMEDVTSVDFSAEPNKLVTPFNTYFARTVIVATGAVASQLGLPREDELRGRGVSYCCLLYTST